jgi:F-type H+-transporting ATPase subunit b
MQEHAATVEHAADTHAAPLPSFNLLGWNLDMNDPTFWALVGLIIFIGVVLYMKVPKAITGSLDSRAAKITSELTAAELAEVQKRAAEAEQEAVGIVAAARREAEQLAATASAQLADRIARREKMAEERITRAEADAIRDVKLAAVETASKAAATVLAEQVSGKAADDEFAKALASVSKALS